MMYSADLVDQHDVGGQALSDQRVDGGHVLLREGLDRGQVGEAAVGGCVHVGRSGGGAGGNYRQGHTFTVPRLPRGVGA